MSGPICNYFIGLSHTKDETWLLSYGPVERELTHTHTKDGESFRYRYPVTDRKELKDTPMEENSQGAEAFKYLKGLHDDVVASLEEDDLIYDGWIIRREE